MENVWIVSEQSWRRCLHEGFVYLLRVVSHWLMVAARALNSWFDRVHSRLVLLVARCQTLLPQAGGHLAPFRGLGVVEDGGGWLEDGAKSEG